MSSIWNCFTSSWRTHFGVYVDTRLLVPNSFHSHLSECSFILLELLEDICTGYRNLCCFNCLKIWRGNCCFLAFTFFKKIIIYIFHLSERQTHSYIQHGEWKTEDSQPPVRVLNAHNSQAWAKSKSGAETQSHQGDRDQLRHHLWSLNVWISRKQPWRAEWGLEPMQSDVRCRGPRGWLTCTVKQTPFWGVHLFVLWWKIRVFSPGLLWRIIFCVVWSFTTMCDFLSMCSPPGLCLTSLFH